MIAASIMNLRAEKHSRLQEILTQMRRVCIKDIIIVMEIIIFCCVTTFFYKDQNVASGTFISDGIRSQQVAIKNVIDKQTVFSEM